VTSPGSRSDLKRASATASARRSAQALWCATTSGRAQNFLTADMYFCRAASLAEAVAKRFKDEQRQTKGQTTANIGTPTAPPSPLSSSAA